MGLKLRENALDLLLLTGMLLSATSSFIPVRWTWGLEVLIWTAMGGLLAGFLLARSIFRPWLAHLFNLIYGVIGTALAVSTRFPDWLSLRLKIMEMALRIWRWLETAWRGQERSLDTLVFVLELAFLSWWISYIAAWFAFRRRKARGILIPSGLFFLWNLYYSPFPLTGYIFVYLLCGLLLVINITLRRRQERWRREGVSSCLPVPDQARVRRQVSSGPGIESLRYGMYFALGIMILAWLIPPLTNPQSGGLIEWLPAERIGVRIQQEWQRLFAALEYPSRGPGEPFGMELHLPGPIRGQEGPVLTVQAPFRRYYWRAVVYDEYPGRGWRDTDTKLALLKPYTSLVPPQEYAMRQEVTQTLTTYLPGTTMLFSASQALRMNIPAKVYYSSEGIPPRPSLWQSHRPLRSEESYTVISSLSIASQEDLRSAGTDYPSWVRERYLQLPDNLPTRVISLAHSITEQATNPYDKVTALEQYLRDIPYNEQVAPPPEGRDGVDYFLFDSREGYCTHYASALAVMARTLSIPSRLAAGYSSGEYDSEKEVFTISWADGHAWTEVFFPQCGWVEFEPTPAEPLIVRPRSVVGGGKEEPKPGEEKVGGQRRGPSGPPPEEEYPYYPGGGAGTAFQRRRTRRRLARALGIAVLVGMIAAGGWRAGRWWIRSNFTPAAWAYARLVVGGRWLDCSLSTGQTPRQYAQELTEMVPQARAPIQHLVELYMSERFGRRRVTDKEAEKTWRELRPLLLKKWLQQRWDASPLPAMWRTLRWIFG
ncbi:MAG: transglutaminaseTgpA domain-containing protein [Chloroflexota bacterium]|nr:transglutaminaseTgpA domain-containing protein [Chloroflexota bacterium]